MARLKTKGDLAELKVAADLAARGYRILFPYGEDNDYDLVADTGSELMRVQVKYAESDGRVVEVRCYSLSLTKGRVRQTKRYTSATIDSIAVYDKTTDRCFYVPARVLGSGRFHFSLRLQPAANNQRLGVHLAEDYVDPPTKTSIRVPMMALSRSSTLPLIMEPAGFEPAASSVQGRRSAN